MAPSLLAQRWDNESTVNLYHCTGDGRSFFVEVGVGRVQAGRGADEGWRRVSGLLPVVSS